MVEPLKDKETCLNCLNSPCKCGMNNRAFTYPVIESAVEWLKENMKKDELKHFTWRVEQLIDKAFEDVTK